MSEATEKEVTDVLVVAREFIKNGFCKKTLAAYYTPGWLGLHMVKVSCSVSEATHFCAIGAISKATYAKPNSINLHNSACERLQRVLQHDGFGCSISDFNDNHSKSDVIRLFNATIIGYE